MSRDRVLHAAIWLADEGGIESLTMRRLGRALGVEAMSLYKHVANKDEVLRRHPWAPSLIMTRLRPARLRYMDWLLGRLRGAGFPPRLAYHAYHALDSHILGFALWEAGHSVGTEDFADVVEAFLRELPVDDYPTSPSTSTSTSPSRASTTWAGSSSSST